VPVIVVDGTEEIFDSRVIVEYLEWLAPSPALIPPEGMERMDVKRWEALGDGICDAGGIWMKERRRKENKSQEVIDRQSRKFERGIEMASKKLGDNQWCHGNAYSLADIAIGSAYAWMAMRYPDGANDWNKRYPNLVALHERLMQRPAFASTTPPVVHG
jgi:glutathione S-transferase